jgi:hypothetical protein
LDFNNFLSYNFFYLLTSFFFPEAYKTPLLERYKNDPSTHPELDPNLWLEVESTSRSDRNRVYDISNTMTEDTQVGCSVLIIGTLELRLRQQSMVIQVIL